MIDRYSKFVLTIIAFALATLVVQNSIRPVVAQTTGCGSQFSPCHIKGTLEVDNVKFGKFEVRWEQDPLDKLSDSIMEE